MTWLDVLPSLLAAAAWLLVPGVLACYALGLRGLVAWGAAPVVSAATIAVSAVLIAEFGGRWSVSTAAAAALVPAVVILVVRLVRRRAFTASAPHDPLRTRLAGFLGLVPAFVLGAVIVARGVRSPANLSQTYDAVFHYNAIRWIVESGNASSLAVGGIGPRHSGAFYPAAWHDLASLIVLSSGGSVAVAANLAAGIVAVVAWPLCCLLLCRQVFGASAGALVVTGTVSVSFTAFPWGLLDFGVLWPNLLGFALVPAGLAAGLSLFGLTTQDRMNRGQAWFVLVAALFGTGLSQPNTTFSLAGLLVFPAGFALSRWIRHQHREAHTWRGVAGGLAVVAVVVVGWIWVHSLPLVHKVKTFDNWKPFESITAAVGEVLLNATNGRDALWLLSAAVVAGLVVALRSYRNRWLPFTHVAVAALFVMAAAVQSSTTFIFTGFWYNDSYRIAATLPITGVVLAVYGVTWAAAHVREYVKEWQPRVARVRAYRPSALACSILVGATLLVSSAVWYQQWAVSTIRNAYLAPNVTRTTLASTREVAFYRRVADEVPPGVVVANNPWDGSGMLWALTGTPVLFPQLNPTDWNPGQAYLARRLNMAARDPKVCEIANTYNVGYVIRGTFDFWVDRELYKSYPGLTRISMHPGFKLVARDGRLELYRITACDAGQASQSPSTEATPRRPHDPQ